MRAKQVAAIGCALAFLLMVTGPILFPLGLMLGDRIWFDYQNRSAFHRHRSLLEATIQKIDREITQPGQSATYAFADRVEAVQRIALDAAPSRLIASDWTYFARRLPDGRLRVELRTYHAGRHGAWSLNYCSADRSEEQLAREEHLWCVTRLAPHWWAAVFAD